MMKKLIKFGSKDAGMSIIHNEDRNSIWFHYWYKGGSGMSRDYSIREFCRKLGIIKTDLEE
jgi:hypothetical protein